MKVRTVALFAGTCLSALVLATPEIAAAAEAADADAKDKGADEIVVTGTYIRGIAATGSESKTVTPQEIFEAGGTTVQDVLTKVPQLSFFNVQPTAGNSMGVGQRQPPQQPSIHGLPTLILLDGHRISSAGAGGGGAATSIDPSIIPAGVLGGIEIVADGGSATYGSDAVGGVINMTTMKKFDGVKVDGTVSFADNYKAYRGDITVGKDWGTGSIYGSYSYTQNDLLLGAQRPYIQQNPSIVTCFPATVTANAGSPSSTNPAVQYSYTGTGTDGKPTAYTTGANRCSRYANESILPAQNMHSVFVGLSQDLNEKVHMDLRAFYSTRRSTSYNAFALVGNVTIPSTNPFYLITPAQVGTTRTQRVDFSLAPAVGPNLPTTTRYDTWGVSGEFSAPLFGDFRARLLGNYNQSKFSSFAYEGLNSTLLSQAIARTDPATALDPYNAAATPGSTLVAQQIANRPTTAWGLSSQFQARLVADGSLFQMGGGDVKVAVGAELLHEYFDAFSRTVDYLGVNTSADQRFSGPRTVQSVFGELNVPIVSPESGGPIHELRFSAAGRYDHYSDFGNTFNPRLALSLMPVEWLTFRATYGKSFIAPSLPQLFSPLSVTQTNNAFVMPPGAVNILIVTGGNPTLKPQKATTWSLGMDLKVPGVDGLKASVTYYNARFRDKLLSGPFTSFTTFYTPTYASFYIQNPTLQQAQAFIGGSYTFSGLAGFPTLESVFNSDGSRNATSPTYISSGRFGNLSAENNQGLDADVSYRMTTGFGSIELAVAGNYVLKRENSSDNITFTDALLTESRFRGTVMLGANVGNFRITGTLLHTAGNGLPTNTTTQTYVEQYNTVDMFMSYTFKDKGILADTQVSLQITNLLNVRPPVNLTASTGYAPGNILGRTFQIGLRKKF